MTHSKNLASDALSTLGATGVAIASTGPAYSLAVTVGVLVAAVGTNAPLVLGLSIVPMILVALSFRELNAVEPDCGTNYTWAKRAFGRTTGWMTGWISVMACVLVMSNLAQVAATFTYSVFGFESLADSKIAQAILGMAMIGAVTVLAYRGIELAARVQVALVGLELCGLAYFVVQALHQAPVKAAATSNPHQWGLALVSAVFLYWGWDAAFSVNEESHKPSSTPARAALIGNVVLLVAFVTVTWSALHYAGVQTLAGVADDNFFAALSDQLLGTVGGKILTLAVLISAFASAESTVIPTARTLLAMGVDESLPPQFAKVSSRFQTPTFATAVFGGASAALYLFLVLTSDAVLTDSVAATGVLIAVYYTATAAAVPVAFRNEPWSLRNIVMRAVVPIAAVASFLWIFALAFSDLSDTSLIVVALVVAIGLLLCVSTNQSRPVLQPTNMLANSNG